MNAGTRIGPYEVTAQLGEGGMGEVWKARDTRLDRTVAAINHPNICALYDVGPNYLVMELVDGVPLAGPLPVAKAVEIAGQILDALDAAHRKGITHRGGMRLMPGATSSASAACSTSCSPAREPSTAHPLPA